MEYFSCAHILTVLALIALIGVLYFAFKNKADHARFVVILVLMGLNLFQHFFKQFLWPNEYGQPFGSINTAYNVCAAVILLSPVLFIYGGRSLRAFLVCAGTASGFVPILLPMRFLGETVFQWEFLRSWTCHALLSCSSLLPFLWKQIPFDGRDIPKAGLYFLGVLLLVCINNCVFYLLFHEATIQTLYDELFAYNPMQIMGPEPDLPVLIVGLVPAFLLDGWNGHAVPVLWYAHLIYLAVTAIGIVVGLLFDGKMRRAVLHPFDLTYRSTAFRDALKGCEERKRNRGK